MSTSLKCYRVINNQMEQNPIDELSVDGREYFFGNQNYLKELHDSKTRYQFECSCNKVSMHIVRKADGYYFLRDFKQGQHKFDCPLNLEYLDCETTDNALPAINDILTIRDTIADQDGQEGNSTIGGLDTRKRQVKGSTFGSMCFTSLEIACNGSYPKSWDKKKHVDAIVQKTKDAFREHELSDFDSFRDAQKKWKESDKNLYVKIHYSEGIRLKNNKYDNPVSISKSLPIFSENGRGSKTLILDGKFIKASSKVIKDALGNLLIYENAITGPYIIFEIVEGVKNDNK